MYGKLMADTTVQIFLDEFLLTSTAVTADGERGKDVHSWKKNLVANPSHYPAKKGEVKDTFESLLANSDNAAYNGTIAAIVSSLLKSATEILFLAPVSSQDSGEVKGQESSCSDRLKIVHPFSCPVCDFVLIEPVTLLCGHTYCKKCLVKWKPSACRQCNKKLCICELGSAKANILVSNLVNRWWQPELNATEIRAKGNQSVSSQDYAKALQLYSDALELAPHDHITLSNRSHVFNKMARNAEALCDAEAAVQRQPFWSKGYFRQAAALSSLGRLEDALVAYVLCAALQDTPSAVLSELQLLLKRILRRRHLSDGHVSKQRRRNDSASERQQRRRRDSGTSEQKQRLRGSASSEQKQRLRGSASSEQKQRLRGSDSSEQKQRHRGSDYSEQKQRLRGNDSSEQKQRLHGNDYSERKQRLRGSGASTDLQHHLHSDDSDSSTDVPLVTRSRSPSVDARLSRIIQRCHTAARALKTREGKQYTRTVADGQASRDDFECTLCYRLLWQPMSTPCGHTFCRSCIDRWLDHSPTCPLCKMTLDEFLADRGRATNTFLRYAMETLLAAETAERKRAHDDELLADSSAVHDRHHQIPIFVCTLALPTLPCPLHVFEPRYRLMVRRSMESGRREFGMCMPSSSHSHQFVDIGVMLKIRDLKYLHDGRSVVDAVGSRRFRCLEKGQRDGYSTSRVEFLADQTVPAEGVQELQTLHDQVHGLAEKWWTDHFRRDKQTRVVAFFGHMPAVEVDYWTLPAGPSWLWWTLAILPVPPPLQLDILAMTSLKRRLRAVAGVLRRLAPAT